MHPAPDLAAPAPDLGWAERSLAVRRACTRLCGRLGWAPVHELPLPNHRRADILALAADGTFACIEVKSGPRDFLSDAKWPDYRAYADRLFFAVDSDFPDGLLPADTGLIVAHADEAEIIRDAPVHPLAPARRRSLTHRFATIAALRLSSLEDPSAAAALRAALRVE